MKDVEWWLSQEPRNTNTHHLRSSPFDLVIHTDASLLGWGATADNTSIGDAIYQRSHSNISMHWSSKQHILQSRLSQGIGNHHRLISTCASTTPQRWHISTRGGGGHTLTVSVSDSTGTLVLCPQDLILGDSNTYSRNSQCRCLHGISSIN
jgi:hypothetical protein